MPDEIVLSGCLLNGDNLHQLSGNHTQTPVKGMGEELFVDARREITHSPAL
ncbi:hypothetical protein GCM10010517_33520 [Streptosporangium fragile]|uniref:Uncharacterized protein n=1 Tax=Streptosporangium fragile TaxID=46186 RepID=A0ABN3VZ15_9ACTN